MGALIAAIIAAIVVGLISYFLGESNGRENEAGKPHTICKDFTLVSSADSHADYASAGSETYSIRKDELAARLGHELIAFPAKVRVCVTMSGGEVSTRVTAP
jgi:hypothetical protein